MCSCQISGKRSGCCGGSIGRAGCDRTSTCLGREAGRQIHCIELDLIWKMDSSSWLSGWSAVRTVRPDCRLLLWLI